MNPPLYAQIYEFILNEIRERRLVPGDMVPSENRLAERFGVSRITSKTSLERLANAGVVERIKGKGTFVTTNALERVLAIVSNNAESASSSNLQLVSVTKRICGLILPDFSETFALGIVHSIEKRCSELGMKLLLKLSYGQQNEENEAIRDFMDIGAQGLIVFPVNGEYYNEHLLRIVLNRFPVVLIDRYMQGISACCVYTDNQRAARELTDLLLEQGHKHVAFVFPPPERTSSIEDRLRGFMDAHSRSEAAFNPRNLLTGLLSTLPDSFNDQAKILHDENMIREFVTSNPDVTAFVANEYNIALLLHETLKRLGKNIPGDYSIVCFDSAPYVFNDPLFTHVSQDEYAMGRAAVDALMEQMHDQEPVKSQIIPFRIIHGKSTHMKC